MRKGYGKRWSKTEKRFIEVERPEIVKNTITQWEALIYLIN